MKIEIEISEEDAAGLWANAWQPNKIDIAKIVEDLAESAAYRYRRAFPGSTAKVVAQFREAIHSDVKAGAPEKEAR